MTQSRKKLLNRFQVPSFETPVKGRKSCLSCSLDETQVSHLSFFFPSSSTTTISASKLLHVPAAFIEYPAAQHQVLDNEMCSDHKRERERLEDVAGN